MCLVLLILIWYVLLYQVPVFYTGILCRFESKFSTAVGKKRENWRAGPVEHTYVPHMVPVGKNRYNWRAGLVEHTSYSIWVTLSVCTARLRRAIIWSTTRILARTRYRLQVYMQGFSAKMSVDGILTGPSNVKAAVMMKHPLSPGRDTPFLISLETPPLSFLTPRKHASLALSTPQHTAPQEHNDKL